MATKNSKTSKQTKTSTSTSKKVRGIPCMCGCGRLTSGRSMFCQGHDAKLKSALRQGKPTPHLSDDQRAYFIQAWGIVVEK